MAIFASKPHLRGLVIVALLLVSLRAPLPAAADSPSNLDSVAVTTVADVEDGDTSSFAALVARPGADQAVSLREALRAANAMPNTAPITITFNLPLPTVTTTQTLSITKGGLPALQRGHVLLDGTTQPAGLPIVLDGGNRNWVSEGLTVTSSANQIRGLTINNFLNNGLVVRGDANANLFSDLRIVGNNQNGLLLDGAQVANNTVQRSQIMHNRVAGIQITNGAHANLVGGAAAAANTVQANGLFGILVDGAGTNENHICSNTLIDHLPTVQTGYAYAIWLSQQSQATTVEQNRIAGNQYGIRIDASSNNRITGNLIGVAADGLTAEPNTVNGVLVWSDASDNIIGGTEPAARNIVSGNAGSGIIVLGAQNTLRNNYIGLGSDGATAIGNGQIGIWLAQSAKASIIEANTIAANGSDGIRSDSQANVIRENTIGLSADSQLPLANRGNGLTIRGTDNHVGPNNHIANQPNGITVAGADTLINGNLIEANGRGICITADAVQVITNTIQLNGGSISGDDCERGGGVLTTGNNTLVLNNVIHDNIGAGVEVLAGNGNRVQANSISNNSAAGIVLQPGANGQIMPPILGDVEATVIRGSSCAGCQVEVFSDNGDQGHTLLGQTTATADGAFVLLVRRAQLTATYITATATDQSSSTSMFAAPFAVPLSAAAGTTQIFLPLTLGTTN